MELGKLVEERGLTARTYAGRVSGMPGAGEGLLKRSPGCVEGRVFPL
jgi:hypothetical protein